MGADRIQDFANNILKCAKTYLVHADRLIYSYGSRTFLAGYDLYDPEHDMRGNIDCSTFVTLVLSGIPYEESPYAKGTSIKGISINGTSVKETSIKEISVKETLVKDISVRGSLKKMELKPADWALQDLADFSNLPDHYVGIAERIGRPYLQGPKGLDLNKAEEMGISVQTLEKEILATGVIRRSVFLADYFKRTGTCFSDPSDLRPADLVFFYSKSFFKEGDRVFQVKPEINHVGIISEDTNTMINSSGKGPAISADPVFGEREIALFAHTMIVS